MEIDNKYKISFKWKLSFCFAMLLTLFLLLGNFNESQAANSDVGYLSDIPYNRSQSSSGWGSLLMDKASDNSLISVKIEGGYYSFAKGIWAHATSNVVYDLREYDYDYFTAYVGLNRTAASSSNGVIFKIYTSADGRTWGEPKVTHAKKPGEDAAFVKIDIRNEKYLKLVADANGNNGNDHSVYADAKLIKEGYKEPGEDLLPSIEELDNKIKTDFANANLETNKEYELTLLKRELLDRVGNYALKKFLGASEENRTLYRWLTEDVDTLRLYVMGGTPNGGNYYTSLDILSKLYAEYSDDFENKELLGNPTNPQMTYGDLYKKMAMSVALTHSQTIGLWMNSSRVENQSEPLRRYAIFKHLHKTGGLKIADSMDMTHVFEDLHVVEMRLVLYNNIDDEEILWLNRYVQDHVDANPGNVWRYQTPHPYIAYIWPNYANPVYYDEANENYFNELFAINKTDNNVGTELANANGKVGIFDSEFVIPGGKNVKEYRIKVTNSIDVKANGGGNVYKVWMNFRNKFGTGCVCGGISKSGANIRGTHGIPAMVVGQPGHAALFFYSKDAQGRGFWRIDNDVSGWTLSGGGGNLLRWGSGSYTQGFSNGVYVELEQAAINDYQNLIKAEEQVMLAKVYKKDFTEETKKQEPDEAKKKAALVKQEELYRKALGVQSINFDAWLGLIEVYNANEDKTEEDFYHLAEEIATNLKYFPLPMYNATNLIKPKLKDPAYVYQFALLQTNTLTEASKLPNNTTTSFTVMQPGVTRLEASYLLGQMDKNIAGFSFDGENAGKIILASRFEGSIVRWDYCIDGHPTEGLEHWHEVFTEGNEIQLTPEELASITAENDIYVHIVGVNYDEKNLYKIDITSQSLPDQAYVNDWENTVLGIGTNTQWRYTQNDNWTLFSEETPDLTGDKTIQIREAAIGTKLASEASQMYTLTANNEPDTRKYVPIKHLSIHSYSTQSQDSKRPFYAPNAIDGNINTMWHTDFAQNVLQQPTKPFIAIELDEPRNISAIEFIQRKYRDTDPIYIKNAIIYVSSDGETWIEAGRKENCAQNGELKAVEFEESVYGKYVKFEMDTYDMFSSVAIMNVYEDISKVTIANFSFNGENAGKIVLVDDFKGKDWEYSLDAGKTWARGTGDSHELTQVELQQINADNDIKVRSNGKESTIIIKTQEAPTISAYLNDLENRLIGLTNIENLEWKIEGNAGWTSYTEQEPIVTGDNKLFIRNKAAGILMPSEAVEFTFTDDNQPDTAKYVPIKHLSIEGFSSTTPNRGEPATNAIDGLPSTMWHTNRTTTTMKDPRWIIIKLDEPRYISKIEYVRKSQYAYGIPKDGMISVSTDGENFEPAASMKNLYNPTTRAELIASEDSKDIVFAESKLAQYIKIECTLSCDYVHGNRNGVPMDYFFSAAMFNVFEDITKTERPTAEIAYSTTELTNQDVTATLVNENMDITVTNNNGSKTYTFTENGTFTFEFVNSKGIKGTATAEVRNIDKTMPNASIEYSTTQPTNGQVVATVNFDKENVRIVDENGNTIENGDTYTFTENGTHEFRFIGPAGNAGTAVATVNWIDKEAPVGKITYSTEYKTNQDIVATITFNEENVTITNNDGNTYTFHENGTFTFEFVDRAGNTGTAIATVNNIDRELPVATIHYDVNRWTNGDVMATVTFDKENVTVEGGNTHLFTQNGTHEFKFVGPAGNAGIAVAKVDWIDKEVPKATITYDIDGKLTNQDVTATIKFNEEDVIITNNDRKNTYTFTENGTFTFQFVDKAGNMGNAIAEVEWIDKVQIVSKITYDINELTNQDVTATITFDKRGVKVVDDNGEEIVNGDTYTFTENGTHEFKYIGPAGNTGTAIAEVNWIDKIPPAAIITYNITEPTNQDVTATITFDEGGVTIVNEKGEVLENRNTYTFTQNGSYTFHYIGPLGNKGTAIAEVNWIDKTNNDRVKGDINGNGEVDIDDLAKLKLHLIGIRILEDAELAIADMDGDGEPTINDLAQMKLELIK